MPLSSLTAAAKNRAHLIAEIAGAMFVSDETYASAVLAKRGRNRVQAVDFYKNGRIPRARSPTCTDTGMGEP